MKKILMLMTLSPLVACNPASPVEEPTSSATRSTSGQICPIKASACRDFLNANQSFWIAIQKPPARRKLTENLAVSVLAATFKDMQKQADSNCQSVSSTGFTTRAMLSSSAFVKARNDGVCYLSTSN